MNNIYKTWLSRKTPVCKSIPLFSGGPSYLVDLGQSGHNVVEHLCLRVICPRSSDNLRSSEVTEFVVSQKKWKASRQTHHSHSESWQVTPTLPACQVWGESGPLVLVFPFYFYPLEVLVKLPLKVRQRQRRIRRHPGYFSSFSVKKDHSTQCGFCWSSPVLPTWVFEFCLALLTWLSDSLHISSAKGRSCGAFHVVSLRRLRSLGWHTIVWTLSQCEWQSHRLTLFLAIYLRLWPNFSAKDGVSWVFVSSFKWATFLNVSITSGKSDIPSQFPISFPPVWSIPVVWHRAQVYWRRVPLISESISLFEQHLSCHHSTHAPAHTHAFTSLEVHEGDGFNTLSSGLRDNCGDFLSKEASQFIQPTQSETFTELLDYCHRFFSFSTHPTVMDLVPLDKLNWILRSADLFGDLIARASF